MDMAKFRVIVEVDLEATDVDAAMEAVDEVLEGTLGQRGIKRADSVTALEDDEIGRITGNGLLTSVGY